MYASLTSFVRDARHNRILAIPAGLYAVRAEIERATCSVLFPVAYSNNRILAIPAALYALRAQYELMNLFCQLFCCRCLVRNSHPGHPWRPHAVRAEYELTLSPFML